MDLTEDSFNGSEDYKGYGTGVMSKILALVGGAGITVNDIPFQMDVFRPNGNVAIL